MSKNWVKSVSYKIEDNFAFFLQLMGNIVYPNTGSYYFVWCSVTQKERNDEDFELQK